MLNAAAALVSALFSATARSISTSIELAQQQHPLVIASVCVVLLTAGPLVALLASLVMLLTLPLWIAPLGALLFAAWTFRPIRPRDTPLRSTDRNGNAALSGQPRRRATFRDLIDSFDNRITTLPDLLAHAAEKFGSSPALGRRRTVRTEMRASKIKVNGQWVEKQLPIPWQTDYEWITFTELQQQIHHFAMGLSSSSSSSSCLGLGIGDKIALFASTRREWLIAAHAAFTRGITIVTAYPSLGTDALVYLLEQSEVRHIVTQASLLSVALEAVARVPNIATIVYMDELSASDLQARQKQFPRLRFIFYDELVAAGSRVPLVAPSRPIVGSDLAVIMYTSGSTGAPKGVMITHQNLVASATAVTLLPPEEFTTDDTYIAYLPLAHILELLAETTFLACGSRIGYSSPTTLRDDSACDEQGRPSGDLALLRPTLMAAVPLILDRMKTGILDNVARSGFFKRTLFHIAYHFRVRSYAEGVTHSLWDRLVFSKVAERFGGRLRIFLSGGAPLAADTQLFMSVMLGCPILQGYGLTETLAGGCIMHPHDRTTGNVGAPIPCCEVKLVDVPELGYTSKDVDASGAPMPRGEICFHGANVSLGYYNNAEATAEAFRVEEDGETWFHTGDIGQWLSNGTLKIIDRKKDLVKLSHGEYIALGNLESRYLHSPLVDNICLHADSFLQRPVAVVVPNSTELARVAAAVGALPADAGAGSAAAGASASTGAKGAQLTHAQLHSLCAHPRVAEEVAKELQTHAKQQGMQKWEHVGAVHLSPVEWTPANGLLTDAMKIKRHEVIKQFSAELKSLCKQMMGE